jgi:hypothetical protein
LLDFTVNGQEIGATVELPANADQVQVHAQARNWEPFERLEIVINGKAVAASEASGHPPSALIEGKLDIKKSGWLVARSIGTANQTCIAHTSPIYVQMLGNPHVADPIHVAYVTDRLNQMLNWAEHGALYENDKQREHLTGIFQDASRELVRRAGGVSPAEESAS